MHLRCQSQPASRWTSEPIINENHTNKNTNNVMKRVDEFSFHYKFKLRMAAANIWTKFQGFENSGWWFLIDFCTSNWFQLTWIYEARRMECDRSRLNETKIWWQYELWAMPWIPHSSKFHKKNFSSTYSECEIKYDE